MNKKQVVELLVAMDINKDTISFCETLEGESPDSEFSWCDITGVQGNVFNCTACSISDPNLIVEFQALDTLIGGALGKAAGAF